MFSYNPGERLSDERCAAIYTKALNEQARQGGTGRFPLEPRYGPYCRRG